MRKISYIGLFACMLLISACSGGQNSATTDDAQTNAHFRESGSGTVEQDIDIAALMTKADVEAALGLPVAEPRLTNTNNPMGQKIMFFGSAAAGAPESAQLSITQTAWMEPSLKATGYNAAKLYEGGKSQAPAAQELPGIGDKAYWHGNLDQVSAGVSVLKGDVQFVVSVVHKDKQKAIEAQKALAKIVAERLP